jgi:E3 SUMO-protein ligase PIAS1
LGDKDLDYLAAQLGSQHERLVTCLKSEGNLAYFKVADLKLLISYLKGKLKKNIKISGNKCDLAQRIAEELFPSGGAGSDDGAGPTQTTLSGYGAMQSSSSYESAPPAKRPRTAPIPQPSVNYNAKLVIMPPNSSPPQLYNEVTFQQQQNPFYRVLKQVSVLSFGPKGRTATDRSQQVRHVFNLDLPTLQELQNGNERKLGVHIRFFSTLKQSDIALGYDSNLRINGKPVDLTKNYKKIRSKHIQNPFITPCPAEVTGLVGQSNMLEFSNQKNISGVAVVQLIQEITAEEIIPSIARSSPEYKKPASIGDVEETKVLVSLRCPLGYCRIEYPARGLRCNHLQCFDVRFFLQFCHQQRLWHCPVCNGSIPFHELLIDEYFNSILNSMDSETMKAEIHPDGTFTKPDKSEKKQRLAGSKRKEVGVQEIDLDAEATNKQRDSAEGEASPAAGLGQELILRPVRLERNSDDEDDDERDGDRAGSLDDDDDYSEDEFRESSNGTTNIINTNTDDIRDARIESSSAPVFLIDDHPAPPPRSLGSSANGNGTGPSGGSQADTIVID